MRYLFIEMNIQEGSQTTVRAGREKVWLAIMLAWVAGFVDLLGYLTLAHIYTSHMSGNSISMVGSLAERNWNDFILHAFPIPVFVLGVFFAVAISIKAGRKGIPQRLSLDIAFEILLLVAFACYHRAVISRNPSTWNFCVGAGLLAMAMGVQSAALRKVWGAPVHTAFVTGMLTHFAENAAEVFFGREDAGSSSKRVALMLLDGGIWFAFVAGATCAGFGEKRWGIHALLFPLCVLVLIIVCDVIHPVHHGDKSSI